MIRSRLVDDALYFGVMLSLIVRWAVSRFPYSGAQKPPMFGDYEAQRHWMEVTVNLPTKEWYKNSSDNDLMYWGLDYPPLTAYQSMLFGYLAKWINSDWVSLNASRGYESYHHKLFMRSSVVATDLLIFYPAVILYWYAVSHPVKLRSKAIAVALTLLYPGFILIDHGHFHLGLALLGIVLLIRGFDELAALFYTLALHYKQMSLYFALPFFCYLLGSCFQQTWKYGVIKLLRLSIVVIILSVMCWFPFLTDIEIFLQVLARLFPFNRGLYEDKVANVWCSLSVLIKLKNLFSQSTLATISALSTLLISIPSSIHLLRSPSLHCFRLALVNSSLVFFLFSYQVHEKSILLAALPVMLLLEEHPFVTTWFAFISTFSLVPLLAKDGLIIPVFAVSALFLVGIFRAYDNLGMSFKTNETFFKTLMFLLSLLGCILLTVAMFMVKPPTQYPDLHVLLNCLYCCFHFLCFTLYFHNLQFTEMPKCLRKEKLKFI